MVLVTRFAPSPTGGLHLGGARTALLNWLQAKAHHGTFLLRIEDTDKARVRAEYIDMITEGLDWLGIKADKPPFFQSHRQARHVEIAQKLLAEGKAYHCYTSPEELQIMRDKAIAEKQPFRYDGLWRDRRASDAPKDIAPVIRIKMPQEGKTAIKDLVQGEVSVEHSQLDDFILLRADKTPTYMLSVVVDDHDMGVTQIIRGDDHLTNAFRQTQLFRACGWDIPEFGHIPLLHGSDGAKLSKRHGAVDVTAFRFEGYQAEAIVNFLLRLGWGRGEDEIIDIEQVKKQFNICDMGRAASRVDFDKLNHFNAHYLRALSPEDAFNALRPFLPKEVSQEGLGAVRRAIVSLQQRSHHWKEATTEARFYCAPPHFPLKDSKAVKALEAKEKLHQVRSACEALSVWSKKEVMGVLNALAQSQGTGPQGTGPQGTGLGAFARPLRAALAGEMASPDLGELCEGLGQKETIKRIDAALKHIG